MLTVITVLQFWHQTVDRFSNFSFQVSRHVEQTSSSGIFLFSSHCFCPLLSLHLPIQEKRGASHQEYQALQPLACMHLTSTVCALCNPNCSISQLGKNNSWNHKEYSVHKAINPTKFDKLWSLHPLIVGPSCSQSILNNFLQILASLLTAILLSHSSLCPALLPLWHPRSGPQINDLPRVSVAWAATEFRRTDTRSRSRVQTVAGLRSP